MGKESGREKNAAEKPEKQKMFSFFFSFQFCRQTTTGHFVDDTLLISGWIPYFP